MQNKGVKKRSTFHTLLSLPALAVTAAVFLLPVASVFSRSFQNGPGEVWGVFTDSYTWSLFFFTLWESFLSALFSTVLALPFAAFFSSYSFPGKKAILTMSDAAFAMPSILAVLGFVVWYGNNGLLNSMLLSLSITKERVKILYSFQAIILAHVYLNFPIAFSLITSALSSLDDKEEMASRLLGKKRLETFFRITIPKVKGTLISSFLLIFLFCFPSFLIVMSLGGNPRYYTLEAEIYRRTYTEVNTVSSSSLSLFSFSAMAIILFLSGYGRKETKIRQNKRTIRKARGGKLALAFFLSFLIFLFMAPPLLSIFYRAFFTKDGVFTLKAWTDILRKAPTGAGTALDAIINSLAIAVSASLFSVALATQLSVSAVRRESKLIPLLTSLPMAAGSVTLGLGFSFIAASIRGKTLLVSYILVFLAHLVVVLPFAVRTIMPGAKKIPQRLSDASLSLGKGKLETYRKVEKPMLRSYRRRAFAFAFALSLGEVNATMALAEGKVTTLPLLIYKMINQYNYQGASALAIVLLLFAMIVFTMGEKEDKYAIS